MHISPIIETVHFMDHIMTVSKATLPSLFPCDIIAGFFIPPTIGNGMLSCTEE